MEREIGEKFKYKKVTLEVVESNTSHPLYPCCDCYFLFHFSCYKAMYIIGKCGGKCGHRDDNREVYFKEVTK